MHVFFLTDSFKCDMHILVCWTPKALFDRIQHVTMFVFTQFDTIHNDKWNTHDGVFIDHACRDLHPGSLSVSLSQQKIHSNWHHERVLSGFDNWMKLNSHWGKTTGCSIKHSSLICGSRIITKMFSIHTANTYWKNKKEWRSWLNDRQQTKSLKTWKVKTIMETLRTCLASDGGNMETKATDWPSNFVMLCLNAQWFRNLTIPSNKNYASYKKAQLALNLRFKSGWIYVRRQINVMNI